MPPDNRWQPPAVVAIAALLVPAATSFAQDLRLAPSVSGTVAAGAPRVYALAARAGEVTSGTLTLRSGGAISVEARDASAPTWRSSS